MNPSSGGKREGQECSHTGKMRIRRNIVFGSGIGISAAPRLSYLWGFEGGKVRKVAGGGRPAKEASCLKKRTET